MIPKHSEEPLLLESGFSPSEYKLHYEGQTAEQLDVKQMNKRDMIILFSFVIVLLTIILGMQTRSILLPVFVNDVYQPFILFRITRVPFSKI